METGTADLANLGLVQNIHLAELRLARAASSLGEGRGKHHPRVTWAGPLPKHDVNEHLTRMPGIETSQLTLGGAPKNRIQLSKVYGRGVSFTRSGVSHVS